MLNLGRVRRTRLRVAMVWGDCIVQDEVFKAPNLVRVGERPDECDFVVSDRRLPPCFELFRPVPGGFVLRVTHAVIGQVFVGAVVGEIPLTRGDHGVVSLGAVAFVFHFVGDGHALPALSLARAIDRSLAPALLAALLIHATVLIASRLAPVDPGPMGAVRFPDRFAKLLITQPTPKPPPSEEVEAHASTGDDDTGGDSPSPKPAAPKPKGIGDGPGAKGHGMIQFLKAGLPGLEDVLGGVGAFGVKLTSATKGPGFGHVMSGGGGWDLHGLPGGGSSFGNRYAFGGIPGGTGGPKGPSGGPGQRKKRAVVAKVRHSKPTATGACDPAAVQRVVKARAAGVRFCYEKQLLRNGDLAGKLTMTWRIGPNGRVEQAYVSDDRLGNRKLAQCVTKQVRRWRFPKPREGAACLIQYPFVFSSGR